MPQRDETAYESRRKAGTTMRWSIATPLLIQHDDGFGLVTLNRTVHIRR